MQKVGFWNQSAVRLGFWERGRTVLISVAIQVGTATLIPH
jgi:hypothetical protein